MTIIILIFLGLLSLGILLLQISNIISIVYGSPYVKANKKVIIRALKLAGLKRGEIFYELGCGNGDCLLEAEKLGAKAVGFEISPYYYLWAKLRLLFLKIYTKNRWSRNLYINIRFKNILDVDLSRADVVYCYLLPELLEKLDAKFKKELKTGARLISIGFRIMGMGKYQKVKTNNHLIYMYKINQK